MLFSSWENYFSQKVWPNPLHAGSQWCDLQSINFALSLAYRYAIHFLATSPVASNRPYSEFIRDLTENALRNSSNLNNSIYIYPYVHRAITEGCTLLPGVNHLLSLAVHGQSLPQEGDLPNSFLVVVPKVAFLFCDRDLATCRDNEIANPVSLAVGRFFDAATANADMPDFIASVLNRIIGEGQAHQKQLGRWKGLAYGADKLLNPEKICYIAQEQDKALDAWQRVNCCIQTIDTKKS